MGHEFHANELLDGVEKDTASAIDPREYESQIPKEFLPRTYGEKLIQPVRLGNLVMLSQTRDEVNPESDNLSDSIERRGLINQLDVARMPVEALDDYVQFVNRIWGAEHDIDELPIAEDGYYYLVIAGHSRTSGIIKNEQLRSQKAREAGYETHPEDAIVHCKIIEAPTPERIIALQLEENIHHQVPKERQAMCIVETYLYGLETGAWSSQSEFVRASNGSFSRELLRNALHFSRLPDSAREQVMVGALRYSTAVALAKTYPEHINYCLFEYFESRSLEELNDDESHKLARFSEEWLGREIAEIQEKKLSATAAGKRLESYRENWKAAMEADHSAQPALFMSDPSEEFRAARSRQRKEYQRIISRLGEVPLRQAARALRIHDQLAFSDTADEGKEKIAQAQWNYTKALGGTAIGRSVAGRMSA